MASCSLCNSFGPTKVQYNYDLAKKHAKTHFLQSKIIDDGIIISQIFETCFPDFTSTTNSPKRSKDAGCPKLTALCRSLFVGEFTTSTPHVVCEKCDQEIKIINQEVLKPERIIEHACYHSNLNMYECRHCMHQFRSRTAVAKHLLTNHQLRTMIGHFRNKADDYVEELSVTIKMCFGGMKKKHFSGVTFKAASMSKVRSFTKGTQLAVERQLLYYRIVRKMMDRNGQVQCRLCSKGISVTDGRNNQISSCIREHAYRHLSMPLYRCRLCSEASFCASDMLEHLKGAHALPFLEPNYECLADQYHSNILAMMNKCYGDESDPPTKEIAFRNLTEPKISQKSMRSKLTLRRHLLCHRLIRKCINAERRVHCRLCSKNLLAKSTNSPRYQPQPIMQHALLHLGKRLYQCKKCSDSFVTRFGVGNHLKNVHVLPLREAYYRCLADDFHGDIVGILRRCYGGEGIANEDEFEEAPTSDNHGSSASVSVVPSKLTIERQTLCRQLTRDCSDQDDKSLVHCRLCNKSIRVVKTANGACSSNIAMLHSLMHLAKPIYRCKICSKTFETCKVVGTHVRTMHALSAANNYNYFGDRFHAEIVEMLRKCYNKETSEPEPSRS